MLDLEAIKARCEAATTGPWKGKDSWHWSGIPRSQLEANRRFIDHARTDIPALVAEVERLQAELARAVAEAREACRQIAEEVALRYNGYGHEAEMNTAIDIANAIGTLSDASR